MSNEDPEQAEKLQLLFLKSGLANDERFAERCGLDRTSWNRYKNGKRPLPDRVAIRMADEFGFHWTDLQKTTEQFEKVLDSEFVDPDFLLKQFRTIQHGSRAASELSSTYGGQYIVYQASRDRKRYVASLLTIKGISRFGIQLEFINPYVDNPLIDDDGFFQDFKISEYDAFEYTGYLFPAGDFLYCLLEQRLNRYELLSIVVRASGAPRPTSFFGIVTGVGVSSGEKTLAAETVFGEKCRRGIDEWRNELGHRLGYLNSGSIARNVQEAMRNSEKVVLRMP